MGEERITSQEDYILPFPCVLTCLASMSECLGSLRLNILGNLHRGRDFFQVEHLAAFDGLEAAATCRLVLLPQISPRFWSATPDYWLSRDQPRSIAFS